MNKPCKHVAIIMDGNGRWAQNQKEQRNFGHLKGSENVRDIAIAAKELGVEVLTLYAFSTENWQRPDEEVAYLMKLPALFFDRFIKELVEENVKVKTIGDISAFPVQTQKVVKRAIDTTQNNSGLILNLAMNYGGRAEIVCATQSIVDDIQSGKISQINESIFEQYLMTADLPSVDLCIRTSGEQRLSNFLLWQLAYSELYFTNVSWPEFTKQDLKSAIDTFHQRKRRFGGL